MQVHSVHEQVVARPLADVFEDLVAMGTPADRIWPAARVPFLRSDGGMQVGVTHERHGPIRAVLAAYEPGATICWRADQWFLRGTHTFEVERAGPDATRVRHVLEASIAWWFVPVWWLQFAAAHDRILIALLKRLAVAPAA